MKFAGQILKLGESFFLPFTYVEICFFLISVIESDIFIMSKKVITSYAFFKRFIG